MRDLKSTAAPVVAYEMSTRQKSFQTYARKRKVTSNCDNDNDFEATDTNDILNNKLGNKSDGVHHYINDNSNSRRASSSSGSGSSSSSSIWLRNNSTTGMDITDNSRTTKNVAVVPGFSFNLFGTSVPHIVFDHTTNNIDADNCMHSTNILEVCVNKSPLFNLLIVYLLPQMFPVKSWEY